MIRPLFLMALAVASASAQSGFQLTETDSQHWLISENGKPVFVYNYGPILAPGFPEKMSRSTYLHPVYLPDGRVITDDFNPDHPHHRGISWMWPVVIWNGRTEDLWTVGKVKQKYNGEKTWKTGKAQATLTVRNHWYLTDTGEKIVNEQVAITIHSVEQGTRRLDFVLTFEAAKEPVELRGDPTQNKGFGGFNMRFAKRDEPKPGAATVIRTEKGVNEKDGVNEVHTWAQVEGLFAGKPGGARVIDDPSNPNYPNNGWLMRHGFGALNPSWPALKPYALVAGKPVTLKYTVVLYSDQPPQQ
ncbi:MAG TPA: DUF6807 family protein [Paludibaculum sp.]|jgi:hypothetical protein